MKRVGDQSTIDATHDHARRPFRRGRQVGLHKRATGQQEKIVDSAAKISGELKAEQGRWHLTPGFNGTEGLPGDAHSVGELGLGQARRGPPLSDRAHQTAFAHGVLGNVGAT